MALSVAHRLHDHRPVPARQVGQVLFSDEIHWQHDGPRRYFWLLDSSVQLIYEPYGWRNEWYVDVVDIVASDDLYTVTDRYIDVVVEGMGPTYRLLDLGEAVSVLTGTELTDTVDALQRFLDGNLHRGAPFPPASIRPLFAANHDYPMWSADPIVTPRLAIRAADKDDVAAVADLWTAANTARHAETGLPIGDAPDRAEAEADVRRRLSDPAAFAVLGEQDGEPVAMALVLQALDKEGASQDPIPGLAHISMVAAHPTRWGRGLAARVLSQAQADARERGFTHAQLWTHETNRRAQRLYERLGWTASGRTKIDDHGEAIRHYEREL